MFCEKCGQEIKDEAKFCSKCGNPIQIIEGIDSEKGEFKKKGQKRRCSISKVIKIMVAALLIWIISIVVYSNSTRNGASQNEKYLEDMNCEQALETNSIDMELEEEADKTITEEGKYAVVQGVIFDNQEKYRENWEEFKDTKYYAGIGGMGISFPEGIEDENNNLIYEALAMWSMENTFWAGYGDYMSFMENIEVFKGKTLTLKGTLVNKGLKECEGPDEEGIYTYYPNGPYIFIVTDIRMKETEFK